MQGVSNLSKCEIERINSSRYPLVPLGEIAQQIVRSTDVLPGTSYRTLGVKWWGEGAYERETIDGSRTAAATLSLVREGDLIINKIWVRHGSTAIVEKDVDGCFASGEFPTFELDLSRVYPRWIHWLTKTEQFWKKCADLSQGTSGKNRIKPDLFLTIEIPLPPLDEQRRIVARIEAVSAKLKEAQQLREEATEDCEKFLLNAYRDVAEGAETKLMEEVAPLVRRPVEVSPLEKYPELGVRSFGKGIFHKPTLSGIDIGGKRIFKIKEGDLIFQIVFAWEG